MRSHYVLCLTLLFLAGSLNAQTHVPLFGEPTRMWTSSFSGSVDAQCLDHWTTTHWIEGDSLIEGVTYQKIRRRTRYWQSPIVSMFCNAWSEWNEESIFVREEGQRVFSFTEGEADHLIYDFTVGLGDTIPFPSNVSQYTGLCDYMAWCVVVVVDSVEVNGSYRKRFNCEDGPLQADALYVIEGIGGVNGPFSPLYWQCGLSHGYSLNCVREFGQVIYGEPFCDLVTSLEFTDMSERLSVYPNPTSGVVQLGTTMARINVVDRTGRTIRTGRGTTMDLSDLANGTYFLRAWSPTGTSHVAPVMVQHD